MKLLVATNNPNKIAELKRMLDLPGLELLTGNEAGLSPDFDVEETGLTFEENATLKAVQYAQATGLPAIADDSGLEVDALSGQPGIYSKRFAGENATDADRIVFLLDKLAGVPDEQRGARFVAAIVLAGRDGGVLATRRGVCEGSIGDAPRGLNGFGYDPVFLVAGQNGRTLAELSDQEKDAVSHRGNAIRLIRSAIVEIVGGQV